MLNSTSKRLNKGPAPWSGQVINKDLHQFKLSLNKANIPVVGYADDLLLFAPIKPYAEKAKEVASHQLDKLGLQLHSTKTSIEPSSLSVIFCDKIYQKQADNAGFCSQLKKRNLMGRNVVAKMLIIK